MLEINKAEYAGDYNIKLVFNNGRTGTAHLKEDIFNDKRPIFSKLKELSNFKKFKIAHNTVVWSDELDLASEYLFYLSFRNDPDLQQQFKEWGYIA